MSRTHRDVEYHVGFDGESTCPCRIFADFNDAAVFAVTRGQSGGFDQFIDVVIWSVPGARAYGGMDAVEQFKEDPHASVFDRIVVRARSEGKIP